LPPDLQASVFVTIHLGERGPSILPEVLSRAGPLPATYPREMAIERGIIYVAPPDHHLILTPETVHIAHGPRENLQRPCINTMFRSAAASHGASVVGVVLTGLLDDGAAGLWEIQQAGGATMVQDPEEAAFRSMPDSAIRGVSVQYIVRLAEMAPLLTRLTMGDQNIESSHPASPVEEPALQSCPECGGAMKMVRLGKLVEYNCHVGHRFGLKTMIAEKSSKVERTMWTALSQSEELSKLLENAKWDVDEETAALLAGEMEQRAREQETLRALMESMKATSLAS
jgi:two-component system, chemotaxis family, protein-glutamate methylesterase/glutaminase